jgi:hypothetical protein
MSSAHLHVAFDQVAKYLEKRVVGFLSIDTGNGSGLVLIQTELKR